MPYVLDEVFEKTVHKENLASEHTQKDKNKIIIIMKEEGKIHTYVYIHLYM